jgi:spore maturation protein CgeB
MKLAIVGGFGGTHIGGSLAKAAAKLGLSASTFDIAEAMHGNRVLRALKWRFAGHRPLQLARFSTDVVAACAKIRPDVLISTGAAALTRKSLLALRAMNIVCVNYSTDDPWNEKQRARWYLRALPAYSAVITARQANIDDFCALGCSDVRYLPFGYDDELFVPPDGAIDAPSYDVLFVGGADRDRIAFVRAFMRNGPKLTVAGGYWDRVQGMQHCTLGLQSPEALRALTAAAKVNLCLVRRANRDDNVMRSFEIGAIGGCMIAEETPGHRAIFGPEGEAVRYFRAPEDAAASARSLLADPAARARLAASLRKRIGAGGHTYRDRLAAMIEIAMSHRQQQDAQ